MNPLLELKHVNKEYQAVKAVNDVSFKVPAGPMAQVKPQ